MRLRAARSYSFMPQSCSSAIVPLREPCGFITENAVLYTVSSPIRETTIYVTARFYIQITSTIAGPLISELQ